ncbi:MAG: trypsin-like peptidase domain-containing protein, partial [Candidatus Liptonbacteria bacterium]|nr:trypsin-like peptidase domain-containing protein [Candidatus Liptonbacteria bacterium]
APAPAAPKTEPYAPTVDYEEATIRAVEKSSPAVVSITISKNVPVVEQCPVDPFGGTSDPFFNNFFGGGFQFYAPCEKGTKLQEVGGGSGFIVSADGLVLTNKHVASDKKAQYAVFLSSGKKYIAKIVAQDPVLDLALLKIDGADLPTIALGNSDGLRLGQTAIAIGNALGEFRNTVSVGVVSGLARTVVASGTDGFQETIEGVIQTDAAINPGNSGGPLLNLRGEAIGINTAIAAGAQSVGFAIPINQAKRAVSSYQANGEIITPYLGIRYRTINEAIAEEEKLPVSRGALARGGNDGPAIMPDSPAAKAGVKAEDIVTEVNGVPVDENHSLASLIQQHAVGDTITLKIIRDKKEIEAKVTLEKRTF